MGSGADEESRGAILLDGDAALCADAQKSGVVNCKHADGSKGRPYRIANWSITGDPVQCPGGPMVMIALCGLTSTVVIEHVSIDATEPFAGGVHSMDSAGIILRDVSIIASSVGIRVQGGFLEADHVFLESSAPVSPGVPLRQELRDDAAVAIITTDADLVLSQVEVDADGYQRGIDVLGGQRFLAEDLNVHGAAVYGIRVREQGDLQMENVTLTNNGLAKLIPAQRFARSAESGDIHISQVRKVSLGGLNIEAKATGLFAAQMEHGMSVEASQILAVQGGAVAVATGSISSSRVDCGVRISYSNILGPAWNHDPACIPDYRRNWWGEDAGPNLDLLTGQIDTGMGSMRTVPELSMSAFEIPWVTAPAFLEAQLGVTFTIRGQADDSATRVEIIRDFDNWHNHTAVGSQSTWKYVGLLEEVGDHRFWARACSVDCGAPILITVGVSKQMVPPVAALSLVDAGGVRWLDANSSYSPAGLNIEAFRFSSYGVDSGWVELSRFPLAEGETVRNWNLEVRDEAGLVSATDLLVAPLDLLEEAPPADAKIPSLSAGLVLVALLGIGYVGGRLKHRD